VAVKVTLVPVQTGFADAATVTDTGRGGSGLWIITRVLDAAGFPVAQFALEVRMQNTTSPFKGM